MSPSMSTETSSSTVAAPPPPPQEVSSSSLEKQQKAAAAKAKKKQKEKSKKKAKKASRKKAPKTKVVVRRLPPNLPEDVFMNTVKRWTGDDVVDYKFYVPGKLSQSKGKESVFSRAYFHMKSLEAVIAFHQGFDGHIFLDSKGNESRAVVEFAPFQKLPKEHKNPDARQGTIDNDPDYLKFLQSLEDEEKNKSEPKEPNGGSNSIERLENRLALVTAQTLATEQANKPKTTPLLDYLRAQKAAQAAAKAKAQAKKAEKKAILVKSSNDGKGSSKGGSDSKKSSRRDRTSKKRKEDKKPAGGSETGKAEKKNGKDQDKTGKPSRSEKSEKSSQRSNKEGKGKGKKESKDSGSSSKSKQASQQGKQPVVTILGRQHKEEKPKNESTSSKKSG